MCGISGIVGFKNISRTLTESINHLEYRGYDSCGIAVMNSKGIISVKKNIGAVQEVSKQEDFRSMRGKIGIAHTRWATHGEVTRENTHPHMCCKSEFSIVHNGIISNYRELRKSLQERGHKFVSETDTEVIVHLIEEAYYELPDTEQAFLSSLKKIEGTFAVVMISKYEPGKIFCAKHESPLIIGVGDDENYVGSDFNAFISYTKNAVVMEDWEYAVITRDRYYIRNIYSGEVSDRNITKITWDNEMSNKGGYPHYMLKEIYEQSSTVKNALAVDRKSINRIAKMMAEAERLYLTGVGTTYYVALFGEYQFASLAGIFVPAISSDEFKHLAQVDENTFVLALSQSGETYDTLKSLKFARKNGAKTAAIINVMGSSIARMVDEAILQNSGPEICVISTKAAIAQMTLIVLLALEVARIKKKITQKEKKELEAELAQLPSCIEKILNEKSGFIHTIANKYCKIGNWLYLGRGKYYAIALEAALKMKEVAYIHAEGMPAGFLKHGTLALIDENLYSVIFVPPASESELFKGTLGSAEEIKARKGFILGFHFGDIDKKNKLFNEEIVLPKVSALIAPFVEMVIAQLFSYFTATALKRNIDKPRSLAKSVTVG